MDAQIDDVMTYADFQQMEKEGWNVFIVDGFSKTRPFQIQKVDEMNLFESDMEVWRFVVARAQNDPKSVYARALRYIKRLSPKEFEEIQKVTHLVEVPA